MKYMLQIWFGKIELSVKPNMLSSDLERVKLFNKHLYIIGVSILVNLKNLHLLLLIL